MAQGDLGYINASIGQEEQAVERVDMAGTTIWWARAALGGENMGIQKCDIA